MGNSVQDFYDQLADFYHLIFEDWGRSIERQGAALNRLLADRISPGPLKILDCACGIGTQSLGFARAGHHVVASDLSSPAVNRARREAEARGLNIEFHIADMTSLSAISDTNFDVVAALDNAIPHLSPAGVQEAVRAMASKLRPGGLFLASTRDYDELIQQKPSVQGPLFYGAQGSRRIVLQVWDWIDQARYLLHQYISVEEINGWKTHHFVSEYRCLLNAEFTRALEMAGLVKVERFLPGESGFFQPIILAQKA